MGVRILLTLCQIVVVPFSILWLFNIALESGPLVDDLYWCIVIHLFQKYDFSNYVK